MAVQDIFFFIRAYNDLDIQMPLIVWFARNARFRVSVIFYPSDGFITHPNVHEATQYVEKTYGVRFRSVLEMTGCPWWLRALYSLKKAAYTMRVRSRWGRAVPLSLLGRAIDAGLGRLLCPVLSQDDLSWLRAVSAEWRPFLLFTDEVLFQPGRSPMIDHIVPALVQKGAHVYAILTGHRVYSAVYPNGVGQEQAYRPSPARRYFVPSDTNKVIYRQLFPSENITVSGNLRMDAEWVETLRQIVPAADLPRRRVNVAIMLSKIDYGVDVERIKETIRRLGRMPDVMLAIKPHTRGMKFNFMRQDEIGDAMVVDHVSSTALIEWADIVLMTGSSIVFHAMVRGKTAGFLKYCQKLETIFDDGQACVNFDSLDELENYLGSFQSGKRIDAQRLFISREIHGNVVDGLTVKAAAEMIMKDLFSESEIAA